MTALYSSLHLGGYYEKNPFFLSFFLSFLLLISCSTSIDNSSSAKTNSSNGLAIVLKTGSGSARSLSRAVGTPDPYTATITVTGGGYSDSASSEITRGEAKEFTFDDVPVGVTLKVTVEIKIGSICVYKGTNSKKITGIGDVIEISLAKELENTIQIPTSELRNLQTLIEACQDPATPNIVLTGSISNLSEIVDLIPANSKSGATLNLLQTGITTFTRQDVSTLAPINELVLPVNCEIETNKNNLPDALNFIKKDSSAKVKLNVTNKDSFQNDQDIKALINSNNITSLKIKDGATLNLSISDTKILEALGNNNSNLEIKISDSNLAVNPAISFVDAISCANTKVTFESLKTFDSSIIDLLANKANVTKIQIPSGNGSYNIILRSSANLPLFMQKLTGSASMVTIYANTNDYNSFVNTLRTSTVLSNVTLTFQDLTFVPAVTSLTPTTNSPITKIALGSKVTQIAANAFANWKELKNIEIGIPGNVKEIGAYALDFDGGFDAANVVFPIGSTWKCVNDPSIPQMATPDRLLGEGNVTPFNRNSWLKTN